ncbi:ABC transporter permease [Adhaeribacter aerolatus]|uniref:ABC transporter permease n=1 Tax=Adhaeribacter aerolatus TaxID=670289 RepID=A0A512B3M4_9BACT|nr:ABC transporter permease [Adhaeribacter aerolatus]GEO06563.1 ABC transporter permease [Adhaeribacter aerolatus]
MLKNYIKIAFRNLLKNKLFSLINIGGMAISMASCLIISFFIYDELKFDKHVADFELKYRVYGEFKKDSKPFSMVPPPVGPRLTAEYPEVEFYTRYLNAIDPALFEVGEKKVTEDKGGFADPSIFDMFSLQLLEGNRNTALKEPGTIAINQTLKQKYFGDKPALGESIKINNENVRVAAVFEDFSSHDHLQLNYFLPMAELAQQQPERMQDWGWTQFFTYIKLKPGTNTELLEAKLKDFVERNAREENFYVPHLMPLAKIHLHATDQLWDIAVRGNIQTVYILVATAIFILIISILNFVNLSTARAVSRVKEVGLRKVVGAFRLQIIYQFISESMVIALIALLTGGLITAVILPSLNAFTGKNIPIDVFLQPQFGLMLLIFALIIGIAAGAYPAFYISGYNPAHILLHKQSGRAGKALMRKGLVVLQFILSFFLIIASLTVSQQFKFMRTTDMGFDKDNLLVVQLTDEMNQKPETTKALFSNHPNILSASLCYGLPGEAYAGETIVDKATNKELGIKMLFVDHDYVKTMGLELVAGRGFSKDFSSDAREAFILSEAAAKVLGYSNPADALNHPLAWPDDDAPKEGKVVGIVKDIQLNSMRDNLEPVVLHVTPGNYSSLIMRIKPTEVPATLAHLEETWKVINTKWPFDYRFLDENFDKMYKSEEKLATLFTFFTGFTIFVACLGLFGLVVYNTTQKYKEISIRKVLGAGELTVVIQLTKNYLLLLGFAFIIAIPFSYYAAWHWLQNFAFRIPLTPLLFLKAGLFITVLSLLTVGIQAYKAARANPVNGLKQ